MTDSYLSHQTHTLNTAGGSDSLILLCQKCGHSSLTLVSYCSLATCCTTCPTCQCTEHCSSTTTCRRCSSAFCFQLPALNSSIVLYNSSESAPSVAALLICTAFCLHNNNQCFTAIIQVNPLQPAHPVKNWRILLVQRFTVHMPLLTATSASGLINQSVREKTLKFTSAVLPTLSRYFILVSAQYFVTIQELYDEVYKTDVSPVILSQECATLSQSCIAQTTALFRNRVVRLQKNSHNMPCHTGDFACTIQLLQENHVIKSQV